MAPPDPAPKMHNQAWAAATSRHAYWWMAVKRSWYRRLGAEEDSRESLGQQRDQTSPSYRKPVLNIIFIGRTDEEAEAPILWPPDEKSRLIGKRPWCWERLRAGGEGGDRGCDGYIASLTQWIWVWANSGRSWRTRKAGVLQSMGSQKVGHDWATDQQQKEKAEYAKAKEPCWEDPG